MRAMLLETPGQTLRLARVPKPMSTAMQVRVKVLACGVCRTDLHVVDGELPSPKLPLIPGHEIVGRIEAMGAAAHILAQIAIAEGREVFAFNRPGDIAAQKLAHDLGCAWAGDAGTLPPEPLKAAIIFAPVGALVPEALSRVEPAGTVVCAGIHMSDIPSFPYALLWGERTLRSVANLTRQDGEEFLRLVARMPIRTGTTAFALEDANEALAVLREGRLTGAAVLLP